MNSTRPRSSYLPGCLLLLTVLAAGPVISVGVAVAQPPPTPAGAEPAPPAPTSAPVPAPPVPSEDPGAVPNAAAPPPPPADDLADASADELLSRAEDAMTAIDYDRTRILAERAVGRGGLGVGELTRAYELISLANAQLGDNARAEQAFLRLFALEPGSKIQGRLSPARRSAALNARGFWAVRKAGFGLDVSFARRDRQVVMRVKDPISWGRTVHLWTRTALRPYLKAAQKPAALEVLFDIPDLGATDALEVYGFVADEHGNVLMEFGRERAPHVFSLTEEELAAILRRDIRGGQTGSYARRLDELGVQVRVHGYASLELKKVGEIASFDLHHATAMIRANLQSAVSVELAFEYEHLGRTSSDFYLPHAFLDMKLKEALVVRGGFFEVPVGAFNEYLYPDFLRITALPPHFSRSVVPALWSEVGLQLRGRFSLGTTSAFTYAVFVGNGLEQRDPMPTDGVVEEGGDLLAMRFNDRDRWSNNKAVGGRLGLELGEFDLGVSGYTGRYTIERPRRLHIVDADASFRGAWLTLRTEAAITHQEVTGRTLRKYGGYALLAARPWAYLEPYAQYDFVHLAADLSRGLGGLAIYPFPRDRETRNLRLKSEAGFDFPQGAKRTFVWFFQLTTGF